MLCKSCSQTASSTGPTSRTCWCSVKTRKSRNQEKKRGCLVYSLYLGCQKHHESVAESFMGCLKYWCHSTVICSCVIELVYSLMGKPNNVKSFSGGYVISVVNGVTQEHHFLGQYSLRLRGEKSHLAHVEGK